MLIAHVNGEEGVDLPRDLLAEAVRSTLRSEGVDEAEISVTFVDDPSIRAMNLKYLGRDRVTDVIAFTLSAGPPPPPLVGDIYIGEEQATRQAEAMGIPRDEELVRLAVHGTLHVLGHDHPEGEEREESELFRRQEALVRAVMPEPAR